MSADTWLIRDVHIGHSDNSMVDAPKEIISELS